MNCLLKAIVLGLFVGPGRLGTPGDSCLALLAWVETFPAPWRLSQVGHLRGARAESEGLHLVHSPLLVWFIVAMAIPKDAPLSGSQQ